MMYWVENLLDVIIIVVELSGNQPAGKYTTYYFPLRPLRESVGAYYLVLYSPSCGCIEMVSNLYHWARFWYFTLGACERRRTMGNSFV